MRLNFQAVNYKPKADLIAFAEKRTDKCHHFYDRIIGISLFTKVENDTKGVNKHADLRIRIPGDDVIVKKTNKTFEEAIDRACDAAERILKKRKEKIRI